MAGASAKKIAAQNEIALRNLRIGFIVCSLLSLALRILLKRMVLHSMVQWAWVSLPFVPSVALYRYLTRLGTPVRDASGNLMNPGSDLNQPGITEWCFDVLYITWACQIGSSLLGPWFWLLYLVIPGFACYKIWTSALGPILSSSFGQDKSASQDTSAPKSKRQQKLQQRAERGDPRVKAMQR